MSFFDRIFRRKKTKASDDLDFNEKSEQEDDVVFAKKFKEGGGLFFYCDNNKEAVQVLQNILITEDVTEILCVESKLISLIDNLDCNHSIHSNRKQDIALINCEFLVALDGSIMISSDQTFHLKKSELPRKIIVWAHPSQIISSSSAGLAKIRYNKKGNIPSNITSIYGNQVQGFSDIATAKKIYLLLVEEIL